MFLEVYAIPVNQYSDIDVDFKVEENRRLIETTGIRIRCSSRFKNRAEIVLPNDTIIHVVGSLRELTSRISKSVGKIVAHI